MTRTEEGSLRQQLRPFHWRSGRWNEPGVQAPAGRGAWAPQAAHATAEGAAQRSQSVSFSCRQLPGRESAPPNTQLSPAPWRAPSGVSLPRIRASQWHRGHRDRDVRAEGSVPRSAGATLPAVTTGPQGQRCLPLGPWQDCSHSWREARLRVQVPTSLGTGCVGENGPPGGSCRGGRSICAAGWEGRREEQEAEAWTGAELWTQRSWHCKHEGSMHRGGDTASTTTRKGGVPGSPRGCSGTVRRGRQAGRLLEKDSAAGTPLRAEGAAPERVCRSNQAGGGGS